MYLKWKLKFLGFRDAFWYVYDSLLTGAEIWKGSGQLIVVIHPTSATVFLRQKAVQTGNGAYSTEYNKSYYEALVQQIIQWKQLDGIYVTHVNCIYLYRSLPYTVQL